MLGLIIIGSWLAGGIVVSPFVYRRWRVYHQRRFKFLEADGEGPGFALFMAATGIMAGPASIIIALIMTHGYGWRLAA